MELKLIMKDQKNYFNLKDLNVFITGAYSHLGQAICEGIGSYGAKLIINGTNKDKSHPL